MSATHDWVPSNDSSTLSLLSLSIAAASVAPIPVAQSPDASLGTGTELHGNNAETTGLGNAVSNGVRRHRRLSSTGKVRRRLSDARDAATRPSPASMQTPSASLSTSLPTQAFSASNLSVSPSQCAAPIAINVPSSHDISRPSPRDELGASGVSLPSDSEPVQDGLNGNIGVVTNGKGGKKRGTDHKCESCSKIYRHPSCLIKHRWEHTPHWREASKFVLSKHQQVQLLEAAAILSHLSPSSSTGTSLPEDRSLWPSFLSGGTLPLPSAAANATSVISQPSSVYPACPTSSSVPAYTVLGSSRSTSAGPRLHDYSIPATAKGSARLTQLRPGLLSVPTGPDTDGLTTSRSPGDASGSLPVPVPVSNDPAQYRDKPISGKSESWSNSLPSQCGQDSPTISNSFSGGGGWSLPRSSLRSGSGSSRSRSGSESRSRSGDESEFFDADIELDDEADRVNCGFSSRGRLKCTAQAWKREEEESSLGFSVREEDEDDYADATDQRMAAGDPEPWDGMDMDMDMD